MSERLPIGSVHPSACYCGGQLFLRQGEYGLFYRCENWPECTGRCDAHEETGQPQSIPADEETRLMRQLAHKITMQLWYGNAMMSRDEFYAWVKTFFHRDDIHIGNMNIYECKSLIIEAQKLLKKGVEVNEPKRRTPKKIERIIHPRIVRPKSTSGFETDFHEDCPSGRTSASQSRTQGDAIAVQDMQMQGDL